MDRPHFLVAGRRVLVAQEQADGLAERLAGGGFQVTACRPAEAAAETERVRPHLILMDAPPGGGWEVIRRVRERAGGVRLLALAGWEAGPTPPAGCDGQLVRPVGADEVNCLLTDDPEEDIPCVFS